MNNYNQLFRRGQVTEISTSDSIAEWNFIGQRPVEVLLGNGLIQTFLNNNRTHSQIQTEVPKPGWGNSSSNRFGYDRSGRAIVQWYLAGGINGSTNAYNDTTPVVGFTTEFDRAGNKMYERELHAETRSSLYQPFDEKGYAQGGYDSLDRLRKVLRGELSASGGYSATGGGKILEKITLPNTDEERKYLLDGLGNWETSNYIPVGGTPTVDLRQHNKQNQITSRKEETKVLFTYDKNGNLKDDGVLLYDYDALNHLTQVRRKSNGQTIGQYVYDAQNRRARKTVSNGGLSGNIPSGTINFIYKDWQVMEERSGSTVNKQYVWGDYVDECIQLRTYLTSGAGSLAAGLYYPLQDLLYRTKVLTDSSGDIVEAYDYDAYGNTLIFSEAGAEDNWWADDATQANYAACEVLYAGYRYDAESKTYQVRNRQYNPVLGRWVQRDPIGFDGGDWNLYGYVASKAVNSFDPTGEIEPVTIIIIIAGVAVLVSGCTPSKPPSPPPLPPGFEPGTCFGKCIGEKKQRLSIAACIARCLGTKPGPCTKLFCLAYPNSCKGNKSPCTGGAWFDEYNCCRETYFCCIIDNVEKGVGISQCIITQDRCMKSAGGGDD